MTPVRGNKMQVIRTFSRDFALAFAVFAGLFAAITMDRALADPIAYLAGAFTGQGLEQRDVLASTSGPLAIALVVALLFSSIIAFKLLFIRHLRRVHASSRRSAWRGN